jgi:hypothetical protein
LAGTNPWVTDFGTRQHQSDTEPRPFAGALALSYGADRPQPSSVDPRQVGGLPIVRLLDERHHGVPVNRMIIDWSTPPSWDTLLNGEGEPPGRGKFLVKVGTRPGIPSRVELSLAEFQLNYTNKRWDMAEAYR